MSRIFTDNYYRDKFSRTEIKRGKKVGEKASTSPILRSFETTLDNSTKSSVSESFVKLSNNGIDIVNGAKINRHYQSSTQVRQPNETDVHY